MKEIITPLTGDRSELEYWLGQGWSLFGPPVLTPGKALLWVLASP